MERASIYEIVKYNVVIIVASQYYLEVIMPDTRDVI